MADNADKGGKTPSARDASQAQTEGARRVTFKVGVPPGSPAYDRAVAMEFGTTHIVAGSAASPRMARSKGSLPWIRPALLAMQERFKRRMEEASKEAAEKNGFE